MENNDVLVIRCNSDGSTSSFSYRRTDEERERDRLEVENYKYFSFIPRLECWMEGDLPVMEFTWWRFRIAHPYVGYRQVSWQWAGKAKPPVYHTLLTLLRGL